MSHTPAMSTVGCEPSRVWLLCATYVLAVMCSLMCSLRQLATRGRRQGSIAMSAACVAALGASTCGQSLPSIDVSQWPVAGPADTTTTGLASLTAGSLRHVELTGREVLRVDGRSITRVLQSEPQVPAALRIAPLAGPMSLWGDANWRDAQSASIDQAGMLIFIRAVRVSDPPGAAPAPVVAAEQFFHAADVPSAGVSLRAPVRSVAVGPAPLLNDTRSLQVPQSGVTFFTRTGVSLPGGGSANPADEALLQAGRDPVIGEFVNRPVLGFGQWAAVWIHLHRGVRDGQGQLLANTGSYSVGVNQQVISRRRGLNLAAAAKGELDAAGELRLPALPGMVWQVTLPAVYRGALPPAGKSIEHGELHQRDLAWHWPLRFATSGPDTEAGVPWLVSGAGSWILDSYARERLHPWRHRLIATLQPGQTTVLTSAQQVGRLAFNEDGWSTLMWPMLRPGGQVVSPGDGTGSAFGSGVIEVLLSGPVAQIPGRVLASIDRTALRYVDAQGAQQQQTLSGADDRYALAIHIHRSGEATMTLINVSATHDESANATPLAWSMRIAPIDLPEHGLGTISIRMSSDPRSTATVTSEVDGMACYRTLSLAAADSYVSAVAGDNLLPAYYMAETNSTRVYSCLEDVYAATAFTPFFAPSRMASPTSPQGGELETPQGWSFGAVLGRPGRTLASWGPRFLSGLSHTRGTRIVLFGGVANDTARALNATLTQSAIAGGRSVLSQLAAWPLQTQGYVTWVEPVYGSGSNFTTPGGRAVFDALLAHGREAFCQTSRAGGNRVSIARMDPVILGDGVHVWTEQESLAAMNTQQSLTDHPICEVDPCGVADFASQGAEPGSDGVLDINDFVVFIRVFFAEDPSADLGSEGGAPEGDGIFDNNDFIRFIDAFFAGC